MKDKPPTLGDIFHRDDLDRFRKELAEASTKARPQAGRTRDGSGAFGKQKTDCEIPASWGDDRTGASFGIPWKSTGRSASAEGRTKGRAPHTQLAYPALSTEARERARNRARNQAEEIADKRAGKQATELAIREASVYARQVRFNTEFARLKEQIAKAEFERLFLLRCKDEVAVAKRGDDKRLTGEVAVTVQPAQPRTDDGMERLRRVSADMSRLRIHGASIHAAVSERSAAIPEPTDGKFVQATLGFDFGTAFSKAVVAWGAKRFAVDWWKGEVPGDAAFWLPSVFSEHADGRIAFGEKEQRDWTTHGGLKMALLTKVGMRDAESEHVVIFLAAASRLAVEAFTKAHAMAAASPIRWRLHLGLPAESWDGAFAQEFRKLAAASLRLGCSMGDITRQRARDALTAAPEDFASRVSVFPEFACQIHSYLHSQQRQRDVHALVDVGAGTLDVAFFNVHKDEVSDVLPLLSAAVSPLGSHYLIGARAGKAGEQYDWHDRDARESTRKFAEKTGDPETMVQERQSAYLNQVGARIMDAFLKARSRYRIARAFRREAPLDLFLCGGGKAIPEVRSKVDAFVRKAHRENLRVEFRVLELPLPPDLEDYRGSSFDRLSVAYGLSFRAPDIGRILGRDDFHGDDDPDPDNGIEDRDATR